MIYREFKGLQLSTLGMGCMRLPTLDGYNGSVDVEQTRAMIDYAISHGVNYFDTAWGYHEGISEVVMGTCLRDYPRESFHLATKFPGYNIEYFDHIEEVFERQLEKTGLDYLDFYLLHNVIESNIDWYLDSSSRGIVPFLLEQKELGRIRHLGFSCHCEFDAFERFMNAWGAEMEFCQIQLNYQDWHFQQAHRKVAWLNEHKVPIIAMEPLRGGQLARISVQEQAILDALRPHVPAAEWGYRYAQSTPGVMVTLSGMSSLAQCKENVRIFETENPLSIAERATLEALADERLARDFVPCTRCRYCLDQCPCELDIPYLISLYNEYRSKDDEHWLSIMKLDALAQDELPSVCLGCNACANICPQHIPIPAIFDDFIERLSRE